ncbi:proline racemase family protein [Nonomuraea sp. NPDC059007]|uniref:proline racemase family protein n=1 Tax=Nonomuraea sp. NPDC059007 TaxID=3346692 RepID=UPI0036B8A6BE
MTHRFLASGSTSGQPVACADLTSIAHGADSMAGVGAALGPALEEVRAQFFTAMAGDPGAIVAVVTRPPRPDADDGLLFVAADGPLGGCGEASMFAGAVRSPGDGATVVFDTAGGLIRATDRGDGTMTLRMPAAARPPGAYVVEVGGRPYTVRAVSVAGNSFLALPAAAAGLDLGRPDELAGPGDAFLREAGAELAARTGERPGLLLLTEPVVDGDTRSAVVWGERIVNVGPCGTGTCARLVLALADGELAENETLRHFSPYGSAFEARLDRASGWSILLRGRVDLSR